MYASLQTSKLTLATLFLGPCILLADGWSEVWPSQANPRQGYRHLSEVYTSCVERCRVAGVTLPVAPAWYRFNRTVFTNCKSRLQAAIPSYLVTNILDTTSPVASNYFGSNPGKTTHFVKHTATGLLWICRMPTNYFAYTPWRSLSGLGGNTNDASVSYPYGDTNAFTVAGGTNFPPGRSAWYTTDYGWQSWPTLISNLVWTGGADAWYRTNTWGTYIHYPESYDTTFAGMKTKVEALWQSPDPTTGNFIWGAYATDSGSYYNGALRASQFYSSISSLPTQYLHYVEFYAWSTNQSFSNPGVQEYSAQGTPLQSNVLSYVCYESSSNAVSTGVFGNTNMPSWVDQPAANYDENGRGFAFVDYAVAPNTAQRYLIRWDNTGGFLFK